MRASVRDELSSSVTITATGLASDLRTQTAGLAVIAAGADPLAGCDLPERRLMRKMRQPKEVAYVALLSLPDG